MFDYSPPIQPFVPNWNKQVTVRALPIESIIKKGSAVIVWQANKACSGFAAECAYDEPCKQCIHPVCKNYAKAANR